VLSRLNEAGIVAGIVASSCYKRVWRKREEREREKEKDKDKEKEKEKNNEEEMVPRW